MPIEAIYVVGITILVLGFAWGLYRSQSRNRANDPIREEATRQLYDEPERYEQGGKAKLDAQLKPEK